MDITHLEVPENAVIIVRERNLSDDVFEELVTSLHEHFPTSLIVWLSDDSTFETMTEEELEGILNGLREHREARR